MPATGHAAHRATHTQCGHCCFRADREYASLAVCQQELFNASRSFLSICSAGSAIRSGLLVIEMRGTCIGLTDAVLVLVLQVPLLASACCLDGRPEKLEDK